MPRDGGVRRVGSSALAAAAVITLWQVFDPVISSR